MPLFMLNVKSAEFVFMNAKLLIQGHTAAMAIRFPMSDIAKLKMNYKDGINKRRQLL